MGDHKSPVKWELKSDFRPFSVKCPTAEILNKYHYVFAIPCSMMKTKATHFRQFRQHHEAQALKLAFHFFLDFMQAMVQSSEKGTPQEPGQNAIVFAEWCPSTNSTKSKLDTAGWRIHVLVDRGVNEMTVLKNFLRKQAQNVEKLKNHEKHVPPHFFLNNLTQYNSRVYSAYTGKQGILTDLYESEVGLENSPSGCFSLEEMPGSIYPLSAYEDEHGQFTFPSFNFLQIDSAHMCFDNFALRRLPDHVMFSMALPEVRIWRGEGLHVEFQPHRYYDEFDVDVAWDEESLAAWISENEQTFAIYEEGPIHDFFRLGEITYCKKLHKGNEIIDRLDLHNMHKDVASEYSKMLRRQHAISMVDHIKLEAIEHRGDKKRFILDEFITHVFEDYEDALVSDPMKSIMRWFDKEYDHDFMQTHMHERDAFRLKYEGVSAFGHRCLFAMEQFDNLYQICSAYNTLHFILLARCDAGRHEHSLHVNCMLTGDAATSKSYLLNKVLGANSIGGVGEDGTISERTYDTAKADAIDCDKDHAVSVFDEAPAFCFKQPGIEGGANTEKKRKLTECSTSHRRPHTDEETGKRSQINSISSNIGCEFIATNAAQTKFDPAFVTRYHFIEAEKLLKFEPGKDMTSRTDALQTMSPENLRQKKACEMWFKFEQGYVFTIWQFIHMGGIVRPTKIVFHKTAKRFTKLMLQYGVDTNTITRTIKRAELLSEICAIIRAKQILYFLPTGKYYGVKYHPSQIPDAEPYLIVTEEIAMHCIGLCFEAIIPRSRNKVLRAIWDMHKANPQYKPSEKYGTLDYNYIEFNATKKVMVSRIMTNLASMKEHVSSCNIETVLQDLDHNKTCRGYSENGNVREFDDDFPQYDTQPRSFQMCETHPAKLYLHMDLFADIRRGNNTNVYKSIMKKMSHEFTAQKLVVLGTRDYNEPTRPMILDTLQLSATNGRRISSKKGIGNVRNVFNMVVDSGAKEDVDIDCDLDVYAADIRSESLGYQVLPFVPNGADWTIETHSYPLEPIREPCRKKKRLNNSI